VIPDLFTTAFVDSEAERFVLLLGLSLFFGFAFEEFYADELPRRPGGVRTFPLLALAGAGLYLIEPHYAAAFIGGLLVLGAWLYAYVRKEMQADELIEGSFVVPVCNTIAYVLGVVALTQPLWMSVALSVAAVLLLGGKKTLHDWVHRFSGTEITTAAKFLILVGVVLPLLAGRPPIPYTSVTPFGVWLAVVAVSSISYASYLLSVYVFPGRGTVLTAMLGGLYSSTATTVVLARRAHDEGMTPELESSIVAASAMMYLRILGVAALFSLPLARILALPMLVLCAVSLVIAWLRGRSAKKATVAAAKFQNPLQLSTALLFAALFVVISSVTALVQTYLGSGGVLALAAVVGVTDIDPFVLGLAQGSAANIGTVIAAAAIVIATSSNNVLKAIYTMAFSRTRQSWLPASLLAGVAGLGLVFAAIILR
jgi:uncharacterized membrane protein (DUF4010 family)